MALPKRKVSKSRRDKRRTHYKAAVPVMTNCSHCGETCRPHQICPNCGYYNGKQVIETKD